MEDSELFSIMSKCFAPVDKDEWDSIVETAVWSEFLDGARRALQDERPLGRAGSFFSQARLHCPLQDFLSRGEVNALFCPPTYEEKETFSRRHFVGGLSESAVPAESLYREWTAASVESPFPGQTGLYMGDSALYMRDLVKRLGLTIPPEFSACPDHLALELDLVAVLLRSGMEQEARVFFAERFAWLTAYRMRLLSVKSDDASFYIGLVDVLMGIGAVRTPTEQIA